MLRHSAMSRCSLGETALDLDKIVTELKSERRRLDLAIAALEVLRTGRSRGRGLAPDRVAFKDRQQARRQRPAKPPLKMEEARTQKAVGDVRHDTEKLQRGVIVAFPSNLEP